MKTLILHHVEPMWADGLKRIGGYNSFEEYEEKVFNAVDGEFNQVIVTRFEDWQLDEGYSYLHDLTPYPQIRDYGYGWEADMFNDENEYVEGGNHSSVVHIAEWMRNLPKKDVFIAGAFDGECLEDLEIALTSLGIEYTRIEELIC